MKRTTNILKTIAGCILALALFLSPIIVQATGYSPLIVQCADAHDVIDPSVNCLNGAHYIYHFDVGHVLSCALGAQYGGLDTRWGNCVFMVSQEDCTGWLSNPIYNSFGVYVALCVDPCSI